MLQPGDFGLGQVPARLKPDATTTIGLRLLLDRLRAERSSQGRRRRSISAPTRDYPVNLGMACPKGWEALTPLAAPDRAHDAAAAQRATANSSRSTGTTR